MSDKKISDDAIIEAKITDSGGIVIEIKSTVKHMFEKHIRKAVETVVKEFEYKNIVINVDDYGALDFCMIESIREWILCLKMVWSKK